MCSQKSQFLSAIQSQKTITSRQVGKSECKKPFYRLRQYKGRPESCQPFSLTFSRLSPEGDMRRTRFPPPICVSSGIYQQRLCPREFVVHQADSRSIIAVIGSISSGWRPTYGKTGHRTVDQSPSTDLSFAYSATCCNQRPLIRSSTGSGPRRTLAAKTGVVICPMNQSDARKARRSSQRPADDFIIDRILIFSAGFRAIK